MKKTNKRGFTIVELVIVIAIIAILAAVLIPTFSSVIKKAQQSSDVQAVRNMNTALAVEQIEIKPETIDDVAAILAEANFNLPRNPLVSGYEFNWISTENVVVLYNTETEKVEFPEEYKDATYDEETWFSLDWEPVTIVEIQTADELYGYLHDSNITDKAKLVANVSSNDITDEDARHFVVYGVKDLDLNGYTISGKGEKLADEGLDCNAIILVSTSGDLTIHDDSASQEGKVEGLNAGEFSYIDGTNPASYAIYNVGKLVVDSGTYIGGSAYETDVMEAELCLSAVAGPNENKENTIINNGTFINRKTGSDKSVIGCTINGGLFSHEPSGCTYKSGYTISAEKNADGYYYLIEE